MSTDTYNPLDALSQRQRQALALLGITHGRQLAQADEGQLWRELEEAFSLFPEEEPLPRSEWEAAIVPLTKGGAQVTPLPQLDDKAKEDGDDLSGDSFAVPGRPLPQLKQRFASNTSGENSGSETPSNAMLPYRKRRKRGIRHQHILRTLFASLSVILFYACAVGIVVWLVYVPFFVAKLEPLHTTILFALLAGLLPYLFLGWMSKCSVCNIGVFSWKRYRRNRLSHNLPLIGCKLPTAVHILLFHWFRCPSCGTPQELRRK